MSKHPEGPRKVLGKGLSALLPTKLAEEPQAGELPIDLIDPNPVQPRTIFEPGKLEELAASIRSNGIIQPLIVQKRGPRYQLIAGERRWRAAKLAGLDKVPAVVRDVADNRVLEWALIENIQREDLNPIEIAQALQRLAKELGLSHEEIGTRTGKDRATITNLLRLLRLPAPVQLLIAEHRLSMGHAKVILGLQEYDHQVELAERATAQGYSVRQTERAVQELTRDRGTARRSGEPTNDRRTDPNVRAAEKELEEKLGTKVRVNADGPEKGHIRIDYYSLDDFDRLLQLISGTS